MVGRLDAPQHAVAINELPHGDAEFLEILPLRLALELRLVHERCDQLDAVGTAQHGERKFITGFALQNLALEVSHRDLIRSKSRHGTTINGHNNIAVLHAGGLGRTVRQHLAHDAAGLVAQLQKRRHVGIHRLHAVGAQPGDGTSVDAGRHAAHPR